MRALAAGDTHIDVVELPRDFGYQVVISTGLDSARGDALVLLSVPVPYQATLYRSIGPFGSALMTWGLAVLWTLMLWRLRSISTGGAHHSILCAKD